MHFGTKCSAKIEPTENTTSLKTIRIQAEATPKEASNQRKRLAEEISGSSLPWENHQRELNSWESNHCHDLHVLSQCLLRLYLLPDLKLLSPWSKKHSHTKLNNSWTLKIHGFLEKPTFRFQVFPFFRISKALIIPTFDTNASRTSIEDPETFCTPTVGQLILRAWVFFCLFVLQNQKRAALEASPFFGCLGKTGKNSKIRFFGFVFFGGVDIGWWWLRWKPRRWP